MPQNAFKIVLLVDGNDENRRRFAAYLRTAGYDIWEAANGADALKLARKNPSIIVLAVDLPDMSGFDVCTTIKENPATSFIPVLHTASNLAKSSDRVRGLEGGADGYLIAPIEPEELAATVRALLRTRNAEVIAHNLAVQWESTFDAISDGICMVAADGTIERCNRAFSTILGKPFHEILGKSFNELRDSELLHDLEGLSVAKSKKKEVSECRTGKTWLRICADPIWSKSKEFSGAVYIVTDITERKEAEIALESANEKIKTHASELEEKVTERTGELRRNIKSLDTFCYTIAHDLKSPLRSIKGFTTILREEYSRHFDIEGKDYMKRIIDSVERMNRLIDDLLNYGRLSNMELPIEPLDLEDEIQFVLNELWAETKLHEAKIELTKPLPAVQANPTVLRQVFSNLISNAIKFVEPGTRPHISVSAETKNDTVRIAVEDNGIGIDPACFERIFEVFERLHGKDSKYPGTGIGLAIVRKGVERMGGKVGVESAKRKGSRFWVELPMAEGQKQE